MAELIDKWYVVSRLISLENEYQFFKGSKDAMDAEKLYRRICELEIEISKTLGSKWIPVTERLPERNDDGTLNAVLVSNGAIQHIAYFTTDEFYFTENGEMKEPMFYDVTHWMPLPEPPKGE